MKAPDKDKFIEAVGIELDSHEKNGQLRAYPNMQHTKGHEANRHGMVDAVQETYQYTRGIQVEGAPQCTWRATRARRALLGHLCPRW